MDTGVNIEATSMGEAEDDTSGIGHLEGGRRGTDRGVTDIRQIEHVESSRKRGWGEMDGEEWDWEREVEEWDNERSRVEEVVEEWEEEVEREERCVCECEGGCTNVTDEEWLQRVAEAAEIEHAVGWGVQRGMTGVNGRGGGGWAECGQEV